MRTNNVVQTVLPVDEATVQERDVSLKVLTIGTKQVTQSLYRQLVEESVIGTETGELRGPVWGWVNLHVDCEAKGEHKHVIWEDNGQLKRSCVYPSFSNYYSKWLWDELLYLKKAYVGLIAIAGSKFPGQTGDKITLTVKGQKLSIDVRGLIKDLWELPGNLQAKLDEAQSTKGYGFYMDRVWHSKEQAVILINLKIEEMPEEIERIKKRIKSNVIDDAFSHLDRCGYESKYDSYTQVYQRMEKIASEITAIEQGWDQSYQTIEDAGQLFIAVSGVWK